MKYLNTILISTILMLSPMLDIGYKTKSLNSTSLISPQELLISKKWNVQGKSKNLFYQYDKNEAFLIVEGDTIGHASYYIDDINCYEQVFDASKVGQTSFGRFLRTEENCYYITVLTDDIIQLSYLSNESPQTIILLALE